MTIYSNTHIVPRSAFGSDQFMRLDAEFVMARATRLEQALLRLGGRRLDQLSYPYDGPVVNDRLMAPVDEVGYVDIDAVDRTDGLIYVDPIHYSLRPSRAKYVLSEGDIIVANVRPNRGAVAWVTANASGALGSSGFTLLRLKEGDVVNPLCIYTFLRTQHARTQLVRRNRGSMYPAVLSQDVLDIVIPYVPGDVQDELSWMVERALQRQETFFSKQQAAETLLDSRLTPLGAPPSPLLSSGRGLDVTVIRRSQAFGSGGVGRIDAEFFRRDYYDFHSRLIETGNYFRLGEYYSLHSGRLTKGYDLVPTLKQGCLTNSGVNWSAVEVEPGRESSSTKVVHEGDILLAATAHEIFYVGRKVDVVQDIPIEVKRCNQAVADLMIIRPRPEKADHIRESFVAAFLRHPSGLHQVQRCIRGLRGGHVYPQDLGQYVLVPDLGAEEMSRFDDEWMSAERTRRQARNLMTDATAALEEWLIAAGATA